MGAVESVAGRVMQRICMPNRGDADWYGGGNRNKSEFPEAHPGSLLLLGHVRLAVHDEEAASRFYAEGLGAHFSKAVADGDRPASAGAGATLFQLPVVPTDGPNWKGASWPGQFYVWVEDIRKTLEDCEATAKRLNVPVEDIVEEVHHVTAEDAVDALVIRDPIGGNLFLVNEAPFKLVPKLRCAGTAVEDKQSNLLAVIDATHAVPKGAAACVARFYSHFLGAPVTKKEARYACGIGYAVHFSFGDRLRQTLTFVEEEDEQGQDISEGVCSICVYLTSEGKFRESFSRCSDAGLVEGPTQTWDEVKAAKQFIVSRCFDPNTQTAHVTLEHIIRHPEHPDLPKVVATPECAQGA
jgi:catechol 2,3-dioxygenase-like lactoylglutathione lyase family enzyme